MIEKEQFYKTIDSLDYFYCKRKNKDSVDIFAQCCDDLDELFPNFDIDKWFFYMTLELSQSEIDKLFTITDLYIIDEMNKKFINLYIKKVNKAE